MGFSFKESNLDQLKICCEEKGLTDYELDNKRILGEFYHPMYVRVIEIKERCVDNRSEGVSEVDGWKAFRKELLENKEYGVNAGLDKWANVVRLKDQIQKLAEKNTSDIYKTTIEELEEQLQPALQSAMPFIPHLGSTLSRVSGVDTTKYTDTANDIVDVPNYDELLQSNPRAFFNRITNSRVTHWCYHFSNSRGTPRKNAIQHTYDDLNRFTHTEKARKRIRLLNQLETHTNGLHGDIKAFVREGTSVYFDQGAKWNISLF